MESFHTPNPYESRYGYARSVRRGSNIYVSGTTAVQKTDPFHLQYPESAYHQALIIFADAVTSIEKVGGTKRDVARVRMYVRDQSDSDEVGRALKATFADNKPKIEVAATMICGVKFVMDEMKVEVGATPIT
ncbi:MAG: hypothetical protein M1814_001599 [Vezdaea aestivalis]|nr:MAG: hypothetical protein M1814_001599 [Vezdaea aestivalis]